MCAHQKQLKPLETSSNMEYIKNFSEGVIMLQRKTQYEQKN